jgi:hypothetical protein
MSIISSTLLWNNATNGLITSFKTGSLKTSNQLKNNVKSLFIIQGISVDSNLNITLMHNSANNQQRVLTITPLLKKYQKDCRLCNPIEMIALKNNNHTNI